MPAAGAVSDASGIGVGGRASDQAGSMPEMSDANPPLASGRVPVTSEPRRTVQVLFAQFKVLLVRICEAPIVTTLAGK